MKIFRRVADVREHLQQSRMERKRIGLVPTMGALHRGHAALVAKAHSECPTVVVTIFVNPLQFGPNEDYSRYPRAFENDVRICEENGADVIFAPDVATLYPLPQLTLVEVTHLSDHLCGPFRPGHFRGVATVVLKLFNIVQPDRAYFGEKDFQQLRVIHRMTEDLNLPLEIVGVPTIREPDGLALSSRNAYLKPEERKVAPVLFEALQAGARLIEGGETSAEIVTKAVRAMLSRESSIRVEYLEIVDADTVQPMETVSGPVRIAAAVWIGATRLIDNVAPVASAPHGARIQ